jgi:hypothetical protein
MRRLDHERRRSAARDKPLERCAREWKAQSLAHGRADIGDRRAGRGRPEHDTVVGYLDDCDPRAREKRDATHL